MIVPFNNSLTLRKKRAGTAAWMPWTHGCGRVEPKSIFLCKNQSDLHIHTSYRVVKALFISQHPDIVSVPGSLWLALLQQHPHAALIPASLSLTHTHTHTNSQQSAACQQTANSSECVVWQRPSRPAGLTLSGSDSLHNLREPYERWAAPNVLWDTLYTAWQLQPHASTSKQCASVCVCGMPYMQTNGIFNLSIIIYRYYMVGGLVDGNQGKKLWYKMIFSHTFHPLFLVIFLTM